MSPSNIIAASSRHGTDSSPCCPRLCNHTILAEDGERGGGLDARLLPLGLAAAGDEAYPGGGGTEVAMSVCAAAAAAAPAPARREDDGVGRKVDVGPGEWPLSTSPGRRDQSISAAGRGGLIRVIGVGRGRSFVVLMRVWV